jgi:hypothetical protein
LANYDPDWHEKLDDATKKFEDMAKNLDGILDGKSPDDLLRELEDLKKKAEAVDSIIGGADPNELKNLLDEL